MLKNELIVKTSLITNFKPNLSINFNNSNLIKKNNKQLYCKNFLTYLLLFKYKQKIFNSNNIFIKKFNKNTLTIIRSPYRHKLARHQIYSNRYKVYCCSRINLKNIINIKNFNHLLIYINFLKKFNNIFESNIIYINSIFLEFPVKYLKNFRLLNFFKKNLK